eukprot:12401414-Karenia_brevis.AAC.1
MTTQGHPIIGHAAHPPAATGRKNLKPDHCPHQLPPGLGVLAKPDLRPAWSCPSKQEKQATSTHPPSIFAGVVRLRKR